MAGRGLGTGRGAPDRARKPKMQCLKVKDRCIYATQFHIEMEGTPETSRLITSNFLRLVQTIGRPIIQAQVMP